MKEEVLRCLLTRRSVRAYEPRQITEDELEAVLQAGLYAPCGHGSQLVTLVAVQDPAVRARLSAINAAILGTDNDPYYGAPTIVVVLSSPERPTWVEDGSCALTVMMEAAHALGLGSCWIHRARQMFDSPEGKALLQAWGVPEDMRGVGALSLGYPAPADEMDMVRRRQGGNPLDSVEQVVDRDGLLALREKAGAVYLSDEVLDYIVRLVGATREHPMILQGASPRATLALAAMAKAAALVRGRDYVNPEDVALVFPDVVPHRLLLSPRAEGDKSFDPAAELLAKVPAPRIA